jgi:hypothetical protein
MWRCTHVHQKNACCDLKLFTSIQLGIRWISRRRWKDNIKIDLQDISLPVCVVGIAIGYGLDGAEIEFRWGRDFPHLSRQVLGPSQSPVPGFPGGREGLRRDADPSSLLVPWSRKSRAIPLLALWAVRSVQSLSSCTVQLYLYSPYGPYGLYRASVPVQYSYTSTPPMGLTVCTEPQFLYSTAIPLLALWAVRSVQSLSACTRAHFTLFYVDWNDLSQNGDRCRAVVNTIINYRAL